jgi:hypothetical protein
VLNLLGAHCCGLVFADLPNGFHHLHEVLVGRKRHREVTVVIIPFLSGDGTIVVATHTVELIEELLEDFGSGLGAINEVLVLGHIVDCVNVLDGDVTVVVAVDELEGHGNHLLSTLSEGVSKSTDELLVGDVAIAIDVVELHEGLDLDNFREKAVCSQSLSELFTIQLLVAVVVHPAEEDTKRADADATALLNLHLELVVDAAYLDVEANSVQL